MPQDRTVLEHLLDGRAALVLEVSRLTTAIEELDTVIGRIGGSNVRSGSTAGAVATDSRAKPVNAPAEVEAGRSVSAPSRARSSRARKSTPRKSTASKQQPGGPKSIRIHVLDMLAGEEREFGLAEIIDRIHAEGIQAHDDAVRSITIKLMKDGKVERVGRGQYRLARRGGAARAASAPDLETTPAEAGPADDGPAAENYTPPLNLGQPWERPAN
jgi:hypothetical protein